MTTFEDLNTKGTSAAPFIGASVFMEGAGSKGAKPRPFNYHLAVRQANHWTFVCALLNANAAASVPLRMFARRRQGGGRVRKLFETRPVTRSVQRYLSGRGDLKPSDSVARKVVAWGEDVEEVIEPHPALTVLERPNPDDNGYEMTVDRFVDLQYCGNAYWYVVASALGVPSLLYRMPPQWVTIKPNDTKRGESRILGYVYGKNTANEVEFTADEVDHFRMNNPKEGGLFYGMGWVEATWQAIGLHNSKRTEDLAFKDNMSRPDWILSVDGGDKDTMGRLKAAVKETFRGAENSGNFLVSNGKLTATALQWEQKELGTPTRLVEEMAAGSGVPVSMLLTNDPNRAGAESSRLAWYRTTVRGYCLRDEQKLNQRYLSRFEGSDDYVLCYDHVSFEDRAAVTREVVALTSGGVISPNEARQELGYQDAPGADFLYPPAGNTGGSASVMGDMSPQQNDDRQPRKMISTKTVARMPVADGDAERTAFLRETFLTFLKDGTVNDVLANLTNLRKLVDEVGVPREEGVEEPFLPVVAQPGPIVNGKVILDPQGDVVGGDVNPLPAAPTPAKPSGDGNGGNQNKPDPAKDGAGA